MTTDRMQPEERAIWDAFRQEVVAWCRSVPSGVVHVTCSEHGRVATVNVSRMPADKAADLTEDTRQFLLAKLIHMIRMAEAARCHGAVEISSTDGPVAAVTDQPSDWRDIRLARGFRPWPIPDDVRAWWREHRGWVVVDCVMHGEVARIDASRDVRMVGFLWDAGLIECDFRYQSDWELTVDDPGFEGADCYPRIIPVDGTLPDDLLKVIEMWIRLEGPAQWWFYELFPWQDARAVDG
jgi:hypothetical protein